MSSVQSIKRHSSVMTTAARLQQSHVLISALVILSVAISVLVPGSHQMGLGPKQAHQRVSFQVLFVVSNMLDHFVGLSSAPSEISRRSTSGRLGVVWR